VLYQQLPAPLFASVVGGVTGDADSPGQGLPSARTNATPNFRRSSTMSEAHGDSLNNRRQRNSLNKPRRTGSVDLGGSHGSARDVTALGQVDAREPPPTGVSVVCTPYLRSACFGEQTGPLSKSANQIFAEHELTARAASGCVRGGGPPPWLPSEADVTSAQARVNAVAARAPAEFKSMLMRTSHVAMKTDMEAQMRAVAHGLKTERALISQFKSRALDEALQEKGVRLQPGAGGVAPAMQQMRSTANARCEHCLSELGAIAREDLARQQAELLRESPKKTRSAIGAAVRRASIMARRPTKSDRELEGPRRGSMRGGRRLQAAASALSSVGESPESEPSSGDKVGSGEKPRRQRSSLISFDHGAISLDQAFDEPSEELEGLPLISPRKSLVPTPRRSLAPPASRPVALATPVAPAAPPPSALVREGKLLRLRGPVLAPLSARVRPSPQPEPEPPAPLSARQLTLDERLEQRGLTLDERLNAQLNSSGASTGPRFCAKKERTLPAVAPATPATAETFLLAIVPGSLV
jgi:hypothetical protein